MRILQNITVSKRSKWGANNSRPPSSVVHDPDSWTRQTATEMRAEADPAPHKSHNYLHKRQQKSQYTRSVSLATKEMCVYSTVTFVIFDFQTPRLGARF